MFSEEDGYDLVMNFFVVMGCVGEFVEECIFFVGFCMGGKFFGGYMKSMIDVEVDE